ncbi:MAG: DUF11 domain-containing protein [Planctomycetia bacterium]|nr:DUF11 domain-containing protein [Planctomycetia bacterium]
MTGRSFHKRKRRTGRGDWPLAALASATLVLCSCRAPIARHGLAPPSAMAEAPCPPADIGAAAVADAGPALMMPAPPPLPYQVTGTWKPPGIGDPWPEDEYLEDGGDHGVPVAVAPDWRVYGLELEDTIVHADTLDGRTLVEPSNVVELYAPRFGSVRMITRLAANDQAEPVAGFDQPMRVVKHDEVIIPTTSLQNLQPERQGGLKAAGAFQTRQGDGAMSQALVPIAFQDAFLPYENISVIRTGQFVNSEKARLATGVQAAITWTADAAVQVIIDNKAAQAVTGDRRAQATYLVEEPNNPKLRIIKVASTQTAIPGETVDFTLRFDNMGDVVLGNIVILDSLTTRLEYVPDTAQSSLPAAFSVRPNEGDSLVLRWEIEDPIEPGEGGVLRFRCVVR